MGIGDVDKALAAGNAAVVEGIPQMGHFRGHEPDLREEQRVPFQHRRGSDPDVTVLSEALSLLTFRVSALEKQVSTLMSVLERRAYGD